jgi:hypothetical protein
MKEDIEARRASRSDKDGQQAGGRGVPTQKKQELQRATSLT